MGIFDNAVKRKTHKERGQLTGRKKLGILEKKKDYRLRARDFERKKKKIVELQKKADLRNEDEFYFAMKNSKTVNGVHSLDRSKPENSAVSAKLAQKLDKGFLETKLAQEKHQLEKMKNNLHFIGVNSTDMTPKQTIFVDSDDELSDVNNLQAEMEKTKIPLSKKGSKFTEKAYAELLKRKSRVETLANAVQHIELKKNIQSKGRRYKVADPEGDRPARYRWAQERKR